MTIFPALLSSMISKSLMYPKQVRLSSQSKTLKGKKVTILLHNSKELNEDFRDWVDENLSLSSLFGIDNSLEGVC